jgi:hypothetical protein
MTKIEPDLMGKICSSKKNPSLSISFTQKTYKNGLILCYAMVRAHITLKCKSRIKCIFGICTVSVRYGTERYAKKIG